jgi:hypothetical protein
MFDFGVKRRAPSDKLAVVDNDQRCWHAIERTPERGLPNRVQAAWSGE